MRLLFLAAAAAALVAPAVASAAVFGGPPIDAVAGELGVSADDLVACSWGARANATQPKGSDERRVETRAYMLECLQAKSPGLTADVFDAVIAKYRPAAQD